MSTASIFRHRLSVLLDAGKGYHEAMCLVAVEPEARAVTAALGNRQQPQSPAHVSRESVAAGLVATGISREVQA